MSKHNASGGSYDQQHKKTEADIENSQTDKPKQTQIKQKKIGTKPICKFKKCLQ